MLLALTRTPSPLLESGERTHIGRDPIDRARALAQHDGYRVALTECGAAVQRLDDGADFPDGVFIEDAAIVLAEVAILTRPGAESRRAEVHGIEQVLRAYRPIERVAAPATIDGGDVVVIGHHILVGRSKRTNAAGIESLATISRQYGYTVTAVRMESCLHLKSGCTALPDGRLIVNSDWIDIGDLDDFDLVRVPAGEPWGGDVAIVNRTVVAAAAYPETIAVLQGEGFTVRPVDVAEFAKAEGGVTCMSLIFESESPSS